MAKQTALFMCLKENFIYEVSNNNMLIYRYILPRCCPIS